jgi:hypothetical protein
MHSLFEALNCSLWALYTYPPPVVEMMCKQKGKGKMREPGNVFAVASQLQSHKEEPTKEKDVVPANLILICEAIVVY